MFSNNPGTSTMLSEYKFKILLTKYLFAFHCYSLFSYVLHKKDLSMVINNELILT